MSDTATSDNSLVHETWWELSEYQTGELELPGQSRLDQDGQKLMEEIATRADAGNLHVPPMPQAAMKAVNLLRSGDPSITQIASAIELDPIMTAHVLRHANSALYSPATVIDTVQHALSFLGLRRTQGLIMEAALKKATGELGNLRYAGMEWQHSLFCAAIARKLGQMTGTDADVCYTAGLLHDIGRIPVLHGINAAGSLPRDPQPGHNVDIIAETIHRGVGLQVSAAWDLPPAIADAIGTHINGRMEDDPDTAKFQTTRVVEAAGDLCLGLGLGRFPHSHAVLESYSLKSLSIPEGKLLAFLADELPELVDGIQALT